MDENYNYKKRPLESFSTTAQEFPSIDTCLQGMKSILTNSTKQLADLMQLSPDAKRNAIQVVRTLWLAYLRAWSDAAEYYGEKHPTIRFSFRDYFLTTRAKLVRRYIAHVIESNPNNDPNKEEHNEDHFKDTNVGKTKHNIKYEDDKSPMGRKRKRTDTVQQDKDEKEYNSNGEWNTSPEEKLWSLNQLCYRKTSFTNMLQLYLGRKRRKGWKEAALSIVPSMQMVTALLWLAVVNGTGLSSCQICDWIRSGDLPLMDAYRHLLNNQQQTKLQLCASFFQMNYPPSPQTIEDFAVVLSVACRCKENNENGERMGGVHYKNTKSIPIWTIESLPTMIAATVLKVGFDQTVLDRTFALIGIDNQKNKKHASLMSKTESIVPVPSLPVPLVKPEAILRLNDIVAIIAIAYLINPQKLRSLQCYSFGNDTNSIPWNESQLSYNPNIGSLQVYLEYAEKFVFQTGHVQKDTSNAEKFDPSVSLLPKLYWKTHRATQNNKANNNNIAELLYDNSSSDDDDNIENGNDNIQPVKVVAGSVLVPTKQQGYEMPYQYLSQQWKLVDDFPEMTNEYYSSGITYDYERMDKTNRDYLPPTSSSTIGNKSHNRDLVIQYLAYMTQLDHSDIKRKIEYLLNLRSK
jgi:hypothetical protein